MSYIDIELLQKQQEFKKVPKVSAFGWVGGKSKLGNTIIAEFGKHATYCEVFAGGLSVLFRKERSRLEIVNDTNSDLINLYKTIQKSPQTLTLYLNYDWENTLFYLDPPYVGTENYYDMPSGFGIAQHELLADLLKNIKGKFVLSYNDCEVVRDLYKDLNIKEVHTTYTRGMQYGHKSVNELLIKNF